MGLVSVPETPGKLVVGRDRWKVKGRRNGGSFIRVPHAVLESENYASLAPGQ